MTSVLDVPYRHGLADLADSPPEEWTDAAFEQCVSVHAASGVRVLTWGTDPAESERVSVDLLLAALRWGRNHHSYVIVDNHPGYDDRTMAMLAVANEIFLVVTPEVGALRNSAQFLELARELGLGNDIRVDRQPGEPRHPARRTWRPRSGLPVSATSSAMARRPSSPRTRARRSYTKFPKEKISDDLHRVARLISSPDVVAAPATAAAHTSGGPASGPEPRRPDPGAAPPAAQLRGPEPMP